MGAVLGLLPYTCPGTGANSRVRMGCALGMTVARLSMVLFNTRSQDQGVPCHISKRVTVTI